MEDEEMKITIVGALAIAGVIVLLIVLAHILRNQPAEDESNSNK